MACRALGSQFSALCSDWLNYGLLATSTNQVNAELRRTNTERQEIAHCAVIKMDESVVYTRPKRVCFCGRNTGHGTSFRKTHACVRQLPAGAMHVPRGTGYCRQERVRTAVIWRKYVGTGVRSKKERVMAEKQPKSRSLKCMFY